MMLELSDMTELSYIQISPNDPRSVLTTYWLVLGIKDCIISILRHVQTSLDIFTSKKLISVSTMWISHNRIINLSLIGLAFPLN